MPSGAALSVSARRILRKDPGDRWNGPGAWQTPVRGARMGERTCSVDGCERKHSGRGWCRMHYERMKYTGSLDLAPKPAPKVCSIDGCEESASGPARARGWCKRHYEAWRRYGDPLGSPRAPKKVGVATCAIDECGSPVFSRDWCVRHYTRWQRFGDPLARMRGEVRDGRRICSKCQVDTLVDELRGGYCRSCDRLYRAEYRARNPGLGWREAATRRARLNQVRYENFDRIEIFERDGWVCQICFKPVDREMPWRKSTSPSLDHIIPIARGGTHSRANSQTACLRCNMRKGARIVA